MVLYVLGAGATRGAQFVKTSANPCFPPLDTDFYTQIQRVRNPKHASLVRQVAADAVDMFGTNFRLTLEAMFTTLEHTARMLEATGESRDFPKRELLDRRQRLMQAIAAVFEESLTQRREGHKELSSLTPRLCGYHERMVKRMRQGETIISFNYDCLIDTTLREYGSEKWNAHYGYGFNLGSRGTRVTGDEYWQPKTPASEEASIRLLKLHGSLHFQVTEGASGDARVRLKQRPYTQQRGSLHFTIIPPESNKQYDRGIFRQLWRRAATAIHRATAVVVIGYSFPITDMHSTALFRTSVKRGSLRSLVVVNPDRESRRRARDVLQRGLTRDTRVLSFDTLAEFATAHPDLWRGA